MILIISGKHSISNLDRPLAGFSAPEDVDYLKWVSETKNRPTLQPEAKEAQLEDLPSGQMNASPPDSVKKPQKSSPPPPPCSGSSLSQESGVENPGYMRYDIINEIIALLMTSSGLMTSLNE